MWRIASPLPAGEAWVRERSRLSQSNDGQVNHLAPLLPHLLPLPLGEGAKQAALGSRRAVGEVSERPGFTMRWDALLLPSSEEGRRWPQAGSGVGPLASQPVTPHPTPLGPRRERESKAVELYGPSPSPPPSPAGRGGHAGRVSDVGGGWVYAPPTTSRH